MLLLYASLPGQLPHIVVAYPCQGCLVFELAVHLNFLLMQPALVVDIVLVLLAHHVSVPLLLQLHLLLVVLVILVVGGHQLFVHILFRVHVALFLHVVEANDLLELVVDVVLHAMQLLLLQLVELGLDLDVPGLPHLVVPLLHHAQLLLHALPIDLLLQIEAILLLLLKLAHPRIILVAQVVLVLLLDDSSPLVDHAVFLDRVVPLVVIVQILDIGLLLLERLLHAVSVELQGVGLASG